MNAVGRCPMPARSQRVSRCSSHASESGVRQPRIAASGARGANVGLVLLGRPNACTQRHTGRRCPASVLRPTATTQRHDPSSPARDVGVRWCAYCRSASRQKLRRRPAPGADSMHPSSIGLDDHWQWTRGLHAVGRQPQRLSMGRRRSRLDAATGPSLFRSPIRVARSPVEHGVCSRPSPLRSASDQLYRMDHPI